MIDRKHLTELPLVLHHRKIDRSIVCLCAMTTFTPDFRIPKTSAVHPSTAEATEIGFEIEHPRVAWKAGLKRWIGLNMPWSVSAVGL